MDIALLIVRLVGIGFAAHGAQKLFGWFGGYGLAGTGGFFESLGFPPSREVLRGCGRLQRAGGRPAGGSRSSRPGRPDADRLRDGRSRALGSSSQRILRPQRYRAEHAFYAALAVVLAFTGYGAYSLDAALGLGALSSPSVYAALAIALGLIGGLANAALRRKPATAQT